MVSLKSVLATQLVILRYIALLVLAAYINHYFTHQPKDNPEAGLDVEQLIDTFGYPVERHDVVTDDGYILTLHRIPSGRTTAQRRRMPILLQHGILNSAAVFVNLGPGKALGLLLADRGFDVWLGNARGSTWSRRHRLLDPDVDQEQYWNFTFHEMGMYDLPASVDYILDYTGQEQLHYLGYSQGASAFFVMASERSEYLAKIRLMTAFAPAVFLGNTYSPLAQFLGYSSTFIENLFHIVNMHEIFTNDGLLAIYMKNVCDENSLFVDWCIYTYSILHGFNYQQVNKTKLSTIFHSLPAGCSTKQTSHLLQLIYSGQFTKFDFGEKLNMLHYGQPKPHSYDLTKAKIPVAIYYGQNDWLIQPKDVEMFIGMLPNVIKQYKVPLKKFNHNDFLHAIDADKYLYEPAINEIIKHSV